MIIDQTGLGPITFINRPSIVFDIAFFSYYDKNASKYFKNPNHMLLFVCVSFLMNRFWNPLGYKLINENEKMQGFKKSSG